MMRTRLAIIVTLITLAFPAHAESFPEFLHAFEATAVASGISPTVYELSTAGLTPDPTIKNLVETQPEFTTPIWTYLDQRVSEARIKAKPCWVGGISPIFLSSSAN